MYAWANENVFSSEFHSMDSNSEGWTYISPASSSNKIKSVRRVLNFHFILPNVPESEHFFLYLINI